MIRKIKIYINRIASIQHYMLLIYICTNSAMDLPPTTSSSSEALIVSLSTLKTDMEDIIHSDDYSEDARTPRSPNRRKFMSDLNQKFNCELSFLQSEFLSDSADLTFSAYRNINSILTIMDDDETALRAENKYFKTLESYCNNYRNNRFAAFTYIPKVLEYILTIEQMRKGYRKDLYEPSDKCKEFIPIIKQIIQQEKERLSNKPSQNNSARKERNSFSFMPLK